MTNYPRFDFPKQKTFVKFIKLKNDIFYIMKSKLVNIINYWIIYWENKATKIYKTKLLVIQVFTILDQRVYKDQLNLINCTSLLYGKLFYSSFKSLRLLRKLDVHNIRVEEKKVFVGFKTLHSNLRWLNLFYINII